MPRSVLSYLPSLPSPPPCSLAGVSVFGRHRRSCPAVLSYRKERLLFFCVWSGGKRVAEKYRIYLFISFWKIQTKKHGTERQDTYDIAVEKGARTEEQEDTSRQAGHTTLVARLAAPLTPGRHGRVRETSPHAPSPSPRQVGHAWQCHGRNAIPVGTTRRRPVRRLVTDACARDAVLGGVAGLYNDCSVCVEGI